MKIKSIKIENNKILGNINLDFTDDRGEVLNTIIIAGENGTGKSTILNIIYEFTNYHVIKVASPEKRTFIIELSHQDIEILNNYMNINNNFKSEILNNELEFKFDFSMINSWNHVKITFKDLQGTRKEISGHIFTDSQLRPVLKTIFSDVEINFSSPNINSVTSKEIDERINNSIKSSPDLAKEITQLLIDIQALDAEDFLAWARTSDDNYIDKDKMDIRMRRFKQAFDFMFSSKRYKAVKNENGFKKVTFEEYGKEISLDKLSSGEKQIVFRGSFLLKDQKSNEGILVLVDEPELSMHPNWQLKIIDFYKKLFTNDEGIQTSQMFFVTHSPFIIHNQKRTDDKVLILKRKDNGEIYIPNEGKYYGWTDEQIIFEAFNIDTMRSRISNIKKNIVITEGKTDWKHLKAALLKFKANDKFLEDDFEFLEYDDTEMGDKNLVSLCEQICKISHESKIICVFDRDVPDTLRKIELEDAKFKDWGNNVFSFAIPVPLHRAATPNISIEHYYSDAELKLEDTDGKRLYIGNEFSCKSGLHIVDQDRFCIKKNKCGPYSIKIIDRDCEVYMSSNEDDNIAMSKNQFAESILKKIEPFNEIEYECFEEIFNIIREIISI